MSTRPESPTRDRRTRTMVAGIVLLVLAVSAVLVVRAERAHAARVQAAIATLSPLQEEPRTTLQLLADDEQSLRRFDAWLLGANLVLVFSALVGLVRTGRPAASPGDSSVVLGLTGVEGLAPASTQQGSVATPAQPESDGDAQTLVAVASLCDSVTQTDAVVRLAPVLAQLASLVPATGIVIWSAPTGSQDLRAVLTHGYPADLVSRLKPLPRSSDNATATACRSGSLQVVRAKDSNPTGAIVAPLMSAAGCVGCLAVEVTRGIEMSDRARRVVRIVAAAMAGRFADSAALTGSPAADVRSA